MATRALTAMGRRTAPADSIGTLVESEPGLRQVLASQNANAIWHSILTVIESSDLAPSDVSSLTQEVFLTLLTSGRLELYEHPGWTDYDIAQDISDLARGKMPASGKEPTGDDATSAAQAPSCRAEPSSEGP